MVPRIHDLHAGERDRSPVPRASARYRELCAAERAAGRPTDHCRSAECDGAEHAALCLCNCAGCHAATVFLRLAEREAMDPGGPPDSDPMWP